MRPKIRIIILSTIAMLAAIAARPAPAAAYFQVCNQTNEQVTLAVADQFDELGGSYHDDYSKGWWAIAEGQCVTPIAADISDDIIYIYAYSASRTWWGNENFCIDPENAFDFSGDYSANNCPTGIQRGFDKVDTGVYSSFTDHLTSE